MIKNISALTLMLVIGANVFADNQDKSTLVRDYMFMNATIKSTVTKIRNIADGTPLYHEKNNCYIEGWNRVDPDGGIVQGSEFANIKSDMSISQKGKYYIRISMTPAKLMYSGSTSLGPNYFKYATCFLNKEEFDNLTVKQLEEKLDGIIDFNSEPSKILKELKERRRVG